MKEYRCREIRNVGFVLTDTEHFNNSSEIVSGRQFLV